MMMMIMGDDVMIMDDAFFVSLFTETRQLLHPQLHQHHPAGAWGDALHAGDAGAAFFGDPGKKAAFASPASPASSYKCLG